MRPYSGWGGTQHVWGPEGFPTRHALVIEQPGPLTPHAQRDELRQLGIDAHRRAAHELADVAVLVLLLGEPRNPRRLAGDRLVRVVERRGQLGLGRRSEVM